MSRAVSVRISACTVARTNGQRRHDLRIGRQPGYVDASRSGLNSVIIPPLTGAAARCRTEELREQLNPARRMRRNAAVTYAGVITFGHGAQSVIEALPVSEQDRLYRLAAERVAEVMGAELTGLVVHRDESAPHAHFQTLSRCRDGQAVAKIGRIGAALQDAVAEVYAPLGIERGTPKAVRQARGEPAHKWVHRSVRQLHADLPGELEEARAKLARAEKRLAATERRLADGRGETEKLEKRIERQKKTLENAAKKLEKLEKLGTSRLPRRKIEVVEPRDGLLGRIGFFRRREKVVLDERFAASWARERAQEAEKAHQKAAQEAERAAKAAQEAQAAQEAERAAKAALAREARAREAAEASARERWDLARAVQLLGFDPESLMEKAQKIEKNQNPPAGGFSAGREGAERSGAVPAPNRSRRPR